MTDNRPETDEFAAALRRDMESSMRPVVDDVIDKATRPYRRMVFWLGLAYLLLITLSIVDWLTH